MTQLVPAHEAGPAERRAPSRGAAACHGCPLYRDATQTVFGAGTDDARLMLVGEQPGDQEDRAGEPFVGPAGRLLREALVEAGLGDENTYVTNAVKHFKFTQPGPGKRRLHQPPSLREAKACRPWLTAELRLVEPELVVALGSTAGRTLLGPAFRVTKDRGTLLSAGAAIPVPVGIVATMHPSGVLRATDREAAYAGLVADLRVAADALHT